MNIYVANWETDKPTLRSIRKIVFIEEQSVPEKLEWDSDDASAIHFLVEVDNQQVATARLNIDGKIGRMAVLKGFRKQKIASQLLDFILQYSTSKNMNNLYLNAQVEVISLYSQFGFSIDGDIFEEAGIPHQRMNLQLKNELSAKNAK